MNKNLSPFQKDIVKFLDDIYDLDHLETSEEKLMELRSVVETCVIDYTVKMFLLEDRIKSILEGMSDEEFKTSNFSCVEDVTCDFSEPAPEANKWLNDNEELIEETIKKHEK